MFKTLICLKESSRYLQGGYATLPTSSLINYFDCISNKSDFPAYFLTVTQWQWHYFTCSSGTACCGEELSEIKTGILHYI